MSQAQQAKEKSEKQRCKKNVSVRMEQNVSVYLWHSLLTSKSEVGCEALSSHDKICFKRNKQKEKSEKQRCKENMSVRMERYTCMYIYVYNYIDA